MSHRHVPEIRVLKILENYSDPKHPLRQKDIAALYKSCYDETLNVKVLRNLLREIAQDIDSVDCTISICYRGDEKQEMESHTDYYVEHPFTDEELRFLIDTITFASYMPPRFKKEMIHKLKSLSSIHFRPRQVLVPPDNSLSNPELLVNIGILDEAICRDRKVELKYLEYDVHCKPSVRRTQDGTERIHVISPYQFAINRGKYYIVCNNDRFDTLAHYRIDRMTAVHIHEDSPRRPLSDLGFEAAELNLGMERYCQEHVYMFSGSATHVKLRIERKLLNEVVDIFGSSVAFKEEGDALYAFFKANDKAIIRFVKSYAPDVELIEPHALRKEIRQDLQKALAYVHDSPIQ